MFAKVLETFLVNVLSQIK